MGGDPIQMELTKPPPSEMTLRIRPFSGDHLSERAVYGDYLIQE
jgi:hypothetical protein